MEGAEGQKRAAGIFAISLAYSEWHHILERECAAYALTLLCFHVAFHCQQFREITLAICVTTIQ